MVQSNHVNSKFSLPVFYLELPVVGVKGAIH